MFQRMRRSKVKEGKKILIVDDRDLAFINAGMLESYGYEVMSAADIYRTYV